MKKAPDLQIFTIGHGSRKKDVFIDLLNKFEIQILIDVRSIPYSRYHPQFRQKQLQSDLQSSGIEYLFLGNELGGRPENSDLYNSGELDYNLVRQTSSYQQGIEQVIDILEKGIKVTLMCSETNPNECHRKYLLSEDFAKRGIKIMHIDKVGEIEMTKQTSLFIE
ncbi:DUF488 domain-containing protein [Pedobacter helvus]|uniref:DUF488 family protein n=1 Tax=Pedobacter helvus TaxID=2563444 RepID=A0ABW9JJH1_9SPHI|nr:DUF488 domain-containing protein [Pedobacter ureilyticus]